MPENGLAKKLGIKAGHRVLALGAPDDVPAPALPEGATWQTRGKGPFDVVLAFVENARALGTLGPRAVAALRPGGALWMAYPKTTSGVTTDLTRDVGWSSMTEAGWGAVSQVAIDTTWSALRFKPEAEVQRKPDSAAAPAARQAKAAPAARDKSAPNVPPDLAAALAKNAAAHATWQGLAPSHMREYVGWLDEAKRAETRARRLEQTLAMLAAGVRDRNAKYRA
jgi:bacteriocin resistance YdeI/OmpD-like protein